MDTDKQKNMLNELQNLLEQQILLVHQGNSSGGRFEALSSRTDSLVREIAEMKILERDELKDRRTQLRKSYEKLNLALTAQKDDVTDKLSQIRRGRKTIGTYKDNI
jgi:hypothetical protein